MKKIIIEKLITFSKQKRSKTYQLIATLIGALFFAVVLPAILIFLGKFVEPYIICSCPPIVSITISALSLPLGICIITWSIITQYRIGHGVPAHIAPTQQLVITGPYRYCRNPMQLGGFFWYLGLGTLFSSLTVGILCATTELILGTLYHKFIEEKELELRFGKAYREYKKRVPFLMPRVRINN